MITQKKISEAIFDKFNVHVELEKYNGTFYWCDPVGVTIDDFLCCDFKETCTYMTRLNDYKDVEQWVLNFEDKYNESRKL